MEERCVIWRYTFVRDYKPPTYKGYYELLIWAGPRGVLNAQEHLLDKQAANRPKENAADWKVDSTQLMQLTGREGGRDFRKATPKWDAASWSSDKNAVMVARLEFSPYFDVIAAKGKEIPGSKSVVWSGRYTPLDHLLYIVDGASGEMLLKYVSPSKN